MPENIRDGDLRGLNPTAASRLFLEKRRNLRFDFFLRLDAWLKLFCPLASGVHDIPWGHLLVFPSLSLRVVTESVYNHVPKRSELPDKQRLGQWNPNVVNNKISALKIANI